MKSKRLGQRPTLAVNMNISPNTSIDTFRLYIVVVINIYMDIRVIMSCHVMVPEDFAVVVVFVGVDRGATNTLYGMLTKPIHSITNQNTTMT